MNQHRLQSNLSFRLMALEFQLRDWLRPPVKILQDAGIQSGMSVLDFGCGPGGFTLAASRLVGPEGLVYAVDIHPLALKLVKQAADKQGLKNIQTVLESNLDEVEAASMDIVLLYDVLHCLPHPRWTLMKLNRLLKPKGVLSVSDHHMKEEKLLSTVTGCDFTRLPGNSRWTLQFQKSEMSGEAI